MRCKCCGGWIEMSDWVSETPSHPDWETQKSRSGECKNPGCQNVVFDTVAQQRAKIDFILLTITL